MGLTSLFDIPCSLFFAAKDSAEIRRTIIEVVLTNFQASIDLGEYRTRNKEQGILNMEVKYKKKAPWGRLGVWVFCGAEVKGTIV